MVFTGIFLSLLVIRASSTICQSPANPTRQLPCYHGSCFGSEAVACRCDSGWHGRHCDEEDQLPSWYPWYDVPWYDDSSESIPSPSRSYDDSSYSSPSQSSRRYDDSSDSTPSTNQWYGDSIDKSPSQSTRSDLHPETGTQDQNTGSILSFMKYSLWNGLSAVVLGVPAEDFCKEGATCVNICASFIYALVIPPFPIWAAKSSWSNGYLLSLWPYIIAVWAWRKSYMHEPPRPRRTQPISFPAPSTRPSAFAVRRALSRNTVPVLRRALSGNTVKFPERYSLARERLAEDNAECAICCDAKCVSPQACLMDRDGKRVCFHFFHVKCAQQLVDTCPRGRTPRCPLCRREFHELEQLPQVGEDFDKWFRLVNVSGSGQISKQELAAALKAILPLQASVLDAKAEEELAKAGGVGLTKAEVSQDGGIYSFIEQYWTTPPQGRKQNVPATSAVADPKALFDAWDVHKRGRLKPAEVLRGCLQTFGPDLEAEGKVYHTYLRFDPSFGEVPPDSGGVTYEDFSKKDGLLEALMNDFGQQLSDSASTPLLLRPPV